MPSKRLLGAGR